MGGWHYNPDRFTRKHLRLPNRNYAAAGAYFVTIRALSPDPLFEIPTLREILQKEWQVLPKQFPHVRLDAFVVMPDHIHFLLWLTDTGRKGKPLGSIVGAYKSSTTVQWIRHLKAVKKDMEYPCRIWQDNYYERVVRIDELDNTRRYILNNPLQLQRKKQP